MRQIFSHCNENCIQWSFLKVFPKDTSEELRMMIEYLQFIEVNYDYFLENEIPLLSYAKTQLESCKQKRDTATSTN